MVHASGPVNVLRPAMTGEPSQQLPTPGPDFVLAPGDILLAPAGVELTFRNAGTVSADALLVAILPSGTPPRVDAVPGVTFRVLASGVPDDIPSGQVMLVLGRAALEPGAIVERDGATLGPALIYVEQGEITYTLVEGQARSIQPAAGTPPAMTGTTVEPGSAVILSTGDAVVEETGTVGEVHYLSGDPVSALFVLITPTETALESPPA